MCYEIIISKKSIMEFEKEFYNKENIKMIKRYSIIFKKKFNLSWKKYFSICSKKLKHSPYWVWIFLCGLEDTFKDAFDLDAKEKRSYLYKESERRIIKITRDYYKNNDYLNSL